MSEITETPKKSKLPKFTAMHIALAALVIAVVTLLATAVWHHNYSKMNVTPKPPVGPYHSSQSAPRDSRGGSKRGSATGQATTGKVMAINAASFTLDNGKIVNTDTNTQFTGNTINGLRVGDQVRVIGSPDSNGNRTARRVLINPSNAALSSRT